MNNWLSFLKGEWWFRGAAEETVDSPLLVNVRKQGEKVKLSLEEERDHEDGEGHHAPKELAETTGLTNCFNNPGGVSCAPGPVSVLPLARDQTEGQARKEENEIGAMKKRKQDEKEKTQNLKQEENEKKDGEQDGQKQEKQDEEENRQNEKEENEMKNDGEQDGQKEQQKQKEKQKQKEDDTTADNEGRAGMLKKEKEQKEGGKGSVQVTKITDEHVMYVAVPVPPNVEHLLWENPSAKDMGTLHTMSQLLETIPLMDWLYSADGKQRVQVVEYRNIAGFQSVLLCRRGWITGIKNKVLVEGPARYFPGLCEALTAQLRDSGITDIGFLLAE